MILPNDEDDWPKIARSHFPKTGHLNGTQRNATHDRIIKLNEVKFAFSIFSFLSRHLSISCDS